MPDIYVTIYAILVGIVIYNSYTMVRDIKHVEILNNGDVSMTRNGTLLSIVNIGREYGNKHIISVRTGYVYTDIAKRILEENIQ